MRTRAIRIKILKCFMRFKAEIYKAQLIHNRIENSIKQNM